MSPGNPQPRSIHYLDPRVQMRVMLAVVAFELLLLAVAMWLLHGALAAAIEERLYSVHLPRDGGVPLLAEVALPVFAGLSVVNVVVLLVAAHLWGRYVNGVLGEFRARLARIAALDLAGRPLPVRPRHPILDRLELWRVHERERLAGLRDACAALDAGAPREQLGRRVEALRASLAVGPPPAG